VELLASVPVVPPTRLTKAVGRGSADVVACHKRYFSAHQSGDIPASAVLYLGDS